MTTIGIDLGTTFSAVATTNEKGITTTLTDREGNRFIASAVYFKDDNSVIVGNTAKATAVMEPDRVATLFKRGMGQATFTAAQTDFVIDGKVWRPEELSSLILKKMLEVAESHLGPVDGAIVTVPAYFGELERSATCDAAELAGLPILRILNEPTAAAIAHGIGQDARGKNILVFDLGGGTFDVTVMHVADDGEMEVLSTGGDRRLGGADFDAIIFGKIVERVQSETGIDITAEPWMIQDAMEKAEEIKKSLSAMDSTTSAINTGQRPFSFTLTRAEFEESLADILENVSDMVEMTFDESGLDKSDIDTILMVGGSSRIPIFKTLLQDLFDKEPTLTQNLDEDVARGASILAAKVSGQVDSRTELAQLALPKDVASHGLGITTTDGATGEKYNALIIKPGQGVPSSGSEMFSTLVEGQTGVAITINEGDEEDLNYVREIGSGKAEFGRPVPKDYPLRVDIAYNEEQIVELHAYDGNTGQLIGQIRLNRQGQLSDIEKQNAMQTIKNMGVQ